MSEILLRENLSFPPVPIKVCAVAGKSYVKNNQFNLHPPPPPFTLQF